MFRIECEKCGEDLMIDDRLTMDEYLKDMDYLINETGEIVEASLQEYLIYKCPLCESTYKYTYKEWEELYRKRLAKEIMEVRKIKMFRSHINPHAINPDNGIEYCGQCSGYDNEGNCLVDIINQCTIRKK